jgi:hypothetical protein
MLAKVGTLTTVQASAGTPEIGVEIPRPAWTPTPTKCSGKFPNKSAEPQKNSSKKTKE